jgi:Plasmid encoded RepA protein
MGTVHQLILTHGVDGAKALTADKAERRCIDAACAVMSDEEQRIGVMHAGFAMTALPHKAVQDTLWVRQGGAVRLIVESGVGPDRLPIGLPYGANARMILLYLQTEAVRTRSREVELGRSMNQWLGAMGIDNGGKSYRLIREQSRRLSLCRLTFYRVTDAATFVTNGSFVRSAILPSSGGDQLQFWQESVKLDEGFYQSLIEHPLPLREAAIKKVSRRSMAIDIYVWLAYRLHMLSRPTPVSWKALHEQFGAGFNRLRAFREKFREPLALALAAYPEAKTSIDEVGMVLYPSEPPVPESRPSTAVRLSR